MFGAGVGTPLGNSEAGASMLEGVVFGASALGAASLPEAGGLSSGVAALGAAACGAFAEGVSTAPAPGIVVPATGSLPDHQRRTLVTPRSIQPSGAVLGVVSSVVEGWPDTPVGVVT